MQQDDIDEINEVLQDDTDISHDIPPPISTMQQNFSKPTILESMKKSTDNVRIGSTPVKATDSSNYSEVFCPMLSKKLVSEFTPGFYSMANPELFPTGKGDITLPRKGKTPSFIDWLKHLIQFEGRRFATHPTFILSSVNRLQRHQALTIGNVYAKRSCPDISFKDLREKIDKGDFNTLRNLFYFGKNIKGSPQYFNSQATISVNFLRHLRISSGDLRTFNLFLTWSAADYHSTDLHRLSKS